MSTKYLVTIRSALQQKYGSKLPLVENALKSLITSDAAKGITTSLIYFDDLATSAQMGFPVLSPVTEKGCKDIIDHLYASSAPDYLAIFGAGDIFPFLQLTNNVYSPGTDDDRTIPSDLPYACNTSYTVSPNAYTDITRVVGRIPDIPGFGDVSYVNSVINSITKFQSSSQSQYQEYFGLTAAIWLGSSQQTTQHVFGNTDNLIASPDAAGGYSAFTLKPLTHFYNCHGGLSYQNFVGEGNGQKPVCLSPGDLTGKVTAGTVVAAECCYGAQLLNSSSPGISIASSYLQNGAAAFMGSSTIAYGLPDSQAQADVLCDNFLTQILGSASTGRALLQARIDFLSANSTPDPHTFKTLCQFYLLGDPSLQPVTALQSKSIFSTVQGRRMELMAQGLNLGRTVSRPNKVAETAEAKPRREILNIMKQVSFGKAGHEMIFESESEPVNNLLMAKTFNLITSGTEEPKTRFRVYQKRVGSSRKIVNIRVLVIKEVNDQVVEYKVYSSR